MARPTPACQSAVTARNPSYRAPRVETVLGGITSPRPPRWWSDTERRLLDEVLANPDADEPRLAYADWAESQNDRALAGEIRRGLAGEDAVDPVSPSQSLARPTNLDEFGATEIRYRRGFVEGLSLTGRAFISRGDEICRLIPLREVRLVAVEPFMGELSQCPQLGNLRRLDLTGNRIGSAGMNALAGSSHLFSILELILRGNDLGSEGLAALARAAWAGSVEVLDIQDNLLKASDVAIFHGGTFPHLTDLDVTGNEIGEMGMGAISRLPKLRHLRAGSCGLTATQLARFGRELFDRLINLDLRSNRVGPVGAEFLAEQGPSAITHFDLGFNDIEDDGVEAIATSLLAPRLRVLRLPGNRITEAGAEALARSGQMGWVEELDLSVNPIGDEGAAAVVAGDAFGSLTKLFLANCGITDRGVRDLTATGALGGLRTLSLAWNPCGDDAAIALAACPDLSGLESLDLTGTRIGFKGAVWLAKSDVFARVRVLRLGENHRLPADAATLLRERFPEVALD